MGTSGPPPTLLPSGATRGPRDAVAALDEVRRVRSTLRGRPGPWLPPVVFGGATVVGALLLLAGGNLAGWWWMVAGPAGSVIVIRAMGRTGDGVGYRLPPVPFAVAAVALSVGGWLVAAATIPSGRELLARSAWSLAVGLGYVVFALLGRSAGLATVGLACATVGVALAALGAPAWAVQLGGGVALLAGGSVLWVRGRRR